MAAGSTRKYPENEMLALPVRGAAVAGLVRK
jgi:hypothetical protein